MTTPETPIYSKGKPIVNPGCYDCGNTFSPVNFQAAGVAKIINLLAGTSNVDINTQRNSQKDDFYISVYDYQPPSVALNLITPTGLQLNGNTITSVTLRWVFNKAIPILGQSMTVGGTPVDISSATDVNGDQKTWQITLTVNLTTDTTFVITGNDGSQQISDSEQLQFGNYIYQGSSATLITDSAALKSFVESLSNKPLQRNYKGTISGYPNGRWVLYALPSIYDPSKKLADNSQYPNEGFFQVGGLGKGGFGLEIGNLVINNGVANIEYDVYWSDLNSLQNQIFEVR